MDFCYQNQDVHTIRMDSLLNAPIESTPILFCARVPLAGRASGLTPAYVVTITKSCHWNVIQCTSQVGCTLLRLEEKKKSPALNLRTLSIIACAPIDLPESAR